MLTVLGRRLYRIWLTPTAALLATAFMCGCTVRPHKKALNYFFSGDPVMAEQTMIPLLEQADHKNYLLYLWDTGMFRFAQNKFTGANEMWRKAGEIAGIEPGALATSLELFSSDASKSFIGDPVEHSISWLFVGLGYYMSGEIENAMIALRKSLEWDYSVDVERQGDMVITNMLLGECFARRGEHDQAAVAYRRARDANAGFLPAQVRLFGELLAMGDRMQAEKLRQELIAKAPEDYVRSLEEKSGGVLVVVMSGPVPAIERDKYLGAFRKRSEVKTKIDRWVVECVDEDCRIDAGLADEMITHFKDQGGEAGQALRKSVQFASQAVLQNVPILGIFAPSAEADVRYWSTVPGHVYAAYLPLTPGRHAISAGALDKKDRQLDDYSRIWHDIPVEEGVTKIVVILAHVNLEILM